MSKLPQPDNKSLSVLHAATEVFLQHGFSAATTDMIQRAAGVSKATVYSRYANKEALFAAVVEDKCATFAQCVKQLEVKPGNIRKVLEDIGHTYLTILLSEEALAIHRVVLAEAAKFPHLAHGFYQAGPATMNTIVTGLLEVAADAGEINVQSVGLEAAASLFMDMVRGEPQLIALTHPGSQASKVQINQWVTRAVDTFLKAYSTELSD
ncbi:MAG: TetR family transcriptional regulator [Oleibacter sp.]|nr:TetR family transcriptional regulator [Thalassolituus sp.]|tara:strand:- start:566 stop:1192 length:627 start_codon:yes stop_codon:yes gene_type:complete